MRHEVFTAKLLGLQRNLLNFAYTLTSDRDSAEDLLQDTTLKVLDNEDKYVDNVNFKGWVFTIMRNLFINGYRKSMRTTVLVDHTEEMTYINSTTEYSPENPEGAVAVHEINDMLNSFDEDYRRPLSLYIAGYKYSEIADTMHLPLGTVKSRIFLARKRLKNLIGSDRFD